MRASARILLDRLLLPLALSVVVLVALARELDILSAKAMSPFSGTLPFAVVEHPGTSMELLSTAMLDRLVCIIPCSVLILLMLMTSMPRLPLPVLPTSTT